MGTRIAGLPFTRTQLATYAYREARQAGLDTDTADAVKHRVLERVLLGGETPDRVIRDEIAKHAAP